MRTRVIYRWWVGLALAVALAPALQLSVFGQAKDKDKDETPKPTITIKSVPLDAPSENMAKDPIKGAVSGVKFKDYKVVIYAYGDKWYVQPTAASPRTDIDDDGTWESQTHGGLQF